MKNLYPILVATLLAQAVARATTLYSLDTTVLDGNTGENTYYVAQTGSTASLSLDPTPSLTYTMASTAGSLTYMVGYFNSTTLTNVGDKISFSLSYTATSALKASDEAFRVGLYNSGGSYMTSNNTSSGSSATNGYTGYAATFRPSGTPGTGNTFKERTGTGNNLFTSSTYTNLGTDTFAPIGTGAVSMTFSAELTAGGLLLTTSYGGNVYSFLDTTPSTTTFDTFAIYGVDASSSASLIFSNLTVDSVPEPGQMALLIIGLGTVTAAACRRRATIAYR